MLRNKSLTELELIKLALDPDNSRYARSVLPLLLVVLFDPRMPLACRQFYGNVFAFKFVDKMNTNHFHITFPDVAFLIVSKQQATTSTQRTLSSAGELGNMSRNNLREISFGIKPIWGINSHFILSCTHLGLYRQNKL